MARASEILLPKEQCQAIRQEPYSNDERGQRYRCTRAASWTVDGIGLCKRHASVMALKILSKLESSE